MKHQRTIASLLILSIIMLSFAAIFVKISTLPPSVLGMYRLTIAGVLLLAFGWWRTGNLPRWTKRQWGIAISSGFFLFLHYYFWFTSLRMTSVASSTIILALQPALSMIIGWFLFKEKVGLRALLPLMLAFSGVLTIGYSDFQFTGDALLGDIYSFLSVIAVCLYLAAGQSLVRQTNHWLYTGTVFMISGFFFLCVNIINGTSMRVVEANDWWSIFLLVLVPNIGIVIHNALLKWVNATTISMTILGEPIGATLLAVLLLGEELTIPTLFGGVLVLGGVGLFFVTRKTAEKSI
ncbi:MAG: DMT family transporter, partial [Bacilli bacterium]